MATATSESPSQAGLRAFDAAFDVAHPKIPLTHREFARKYVTMPPSGPHGDEAYRDDWQPVVGLLWDELDKNYWREVAVTGPVQASKSFGALVIPTLRDIVELRFSPILGVPEADMFADKWDKDFRPVLAASKELRWLLPEIGSGQRGGRVRDRVTFGNGTDLKVMSRGGQATNKAGFTSPRLRITEASGFSEASASERDEEADSYRQLIGRLGAFDLTDPRRLVMVEGTGTIEDHLPWRLRGKDDDENLISTRSRLVSPCPHCEAWISPEREHLVGWQDAASVMQVLDDAAFVCPVCSLQIKDDQRKKSLQDVRIVHHGQEIKPDGTISGPLPPVLRLWFRWSAWHNCLINAGTIAVAEWEASQIEEGTVDRENAERDLCQKKWAVPYRPREGENPRLDAKVLQKRQSGWQRGMIPADNDILTIGVDPGKWTAWWCALSTREDGSEHVPAYGAFDVLRSHDEKIVDRMPRALEAFHQDRVLEGFPQAGVDGLLLPDGVGVDIADWPDDIAVFLREIGAGWNSRWQGVRGAGVSVRRSNGSYRQPNRICGDVRRLGRQWHGKWNYDRKIPEITMNADYWLRDLQDRLRSSPKMEGRVAKYAAGAITFYEVDHPKEHARLASHLAAEQLEDVRDDKTGLPVKKFVRHGDNHLSDALKIARMMADYVRHERIRQYDQAAMVSLSDLKKQRIEGK